MNRRRVDSSEKENMKRFSVFNLRQVRGRLLSGVLAGLLCLGSAGCSEGREESRDPKIPKDYKVVAGTELCGGNAISVEASRALELITGESRFEASAEEYTIARAADDVVNAYPDLNVGRQDICGVYTPIGKPSFEIKISWDASPSPPTGSPASKFTELRMGERTVAAADKAMVFFSCRGTRLPDSLGLAHLIVMVQHWAVPREFEGDVKALKDADATVAQSVALAMAKELRCEGNGGLPEKPVLDPV